MQDRRCPYCEKNTEASESQTSVSKFGHFYRRSDRKYIQRLRCRVCKRCFSVATKDPCYHQRKRQFNLAILGQLASGVTQRRTAILFGINRKTVARKLVFMGSHALESLRLMNQNKPQAICIEFDDLETFEHTKCKPLSVTLAVEHKTRRILGFSVSRMPAKGRLAEKSVKKYGPRPDERAFGRKQLFLEIQDLVHPSAVIKSDQNPHYPKDVREHFPNAKHIAYKGRRPAHSGQGELKEGVFDPLFSLNHTFAKMRADIGRLIRETWTTTKKPERLYLNIALMAVFHNTLLNRRK